MDSQQTMKDLILANSKWEALYRKATEDLKHADEMIRRLGNQLHELGETPKQCPYCYGKVEVDTVHENMSTPTAPIVRLTCANNEFPSHLFGNVVHYDEAFDVNELGEAHYIFASDDEATMKTPPRSSITKTTPPKLVRQTNRL